MAIESSFATVRYRTKRSKGYVYLGKNLDGKNQLPKIISGVKFSDGWEVIDHAEVTA